MSVRFRLRAPKTPARKHLVNPELLLPAREEVSPPTLAGNPREVLRADSELRRHPFGGVSVH
jgi:hypothetical protein